MSCFRTGQLFYSMGRPLSQNYPPSPRSPIDSEMVRPLFLLILKVFLPDNLNVTQQPFGRKSCHEDRHV